MRRRYVGSLVLLSVAALCLGALPDTQTASLTQWNMPFAAAFPGGFDLDANGMVYVATNSGMSIVRLDPANDMFRSWGVSEHPQDVVVIDDVVVCTVREANQISYLNPNSQSTTTFIIPFPDAHPGELHRGPDTADGKLTFWITEPSVQGVLRMEYDPTDPPWISGVPSDYQATQRLQSIIPSMITAEHEQFSYNTSLIPDPFPIAATQISPPYTEWRLSLGDDRRVEDLAVADDGTLWISFGTAFLVRLDPMAGTLQWLETIQNEAAIFQGLLPGPDGSVWFGNIVDGSIGHLNPSTGLSEVWHIPGTIEVYDLAFDADGMIWYTDRVGEMIGRLDPTTNEAIVYTLEPDSEPLYLAIDAAGDVWFTAGFGNYVGRLSPLP